MQIHAASGVAKQGIKKLRPQIKYLRAENNFLP
jgi:hypothetical protein